jgi:uncharacterized protein (DUF983 family)
MPKFLWAWLVLQGAGLMVDPLLNPGPWKPTLRLAVWALLLACIAFGILHHVKGAWLIAVAFAGLG